MNNLGLSKPHQRLSLVVDLDERGCFNAHVENQEGENVFQFSNEDESGWPSDDGLWLIDDGYMKHGRDTVGLLDFLKSNGIATPNATLTLNNN